MENLERTCTVAKGAEAFETASVIKINEQIISIIYSKYYTH